MRFVIASFLIISFSFCKGKPTPTAVKETKDNTKFFQVNEYIESQINEVNRSPYFIYELNIIGTNKDSTAIDNKIFNELAKQFLQVNINDPALKSNYKESVFFDETTKNFNISYSTANKDLEIQNVDVLLQENGETVKRIFIKKFLNYTDSSAVEQLIWKPNESFQIIRLVQSSKDNSEVSRQNVVVWNEKG